VKHQPKPIATEADYQKALRQFEKLMTPYPNEPLGQLLDVLGTLIEQYENREYPLPTVSPGKMLSHLMEVRGLKVAELAEATAINKGTISSIRGSNRGVSKENAMKLAAYFRVPAEAFIEKPSVANLAASYVTVKPKKKARSSLTAKKTN